MGALQSFRENQVNQKDDTWGGAAAGSLKAGIQATAQLFGEDIGKEVRF